MKSSLKHVLPEEISEEAERLILERIKGKMRGGVGLFVAAVRALEKKYGPEVREVVRDALLTKKARPADQGAARNLKHPWPDMGVNQSLTLSSLADGGNGASSALYRTQAARTEGQER